MKALAIKADEYIFHLGKSDPKNIKVYVKEVPRSEFTKKILPVISEIYRENSKCY
ncbi:hypothetical protein [Brevibacillus sp. VP]|uniref:hypothetical protein n=1 Tax=Brevibacillus sp. VP TaxID=2293326 RepID=UPI001374DD20|nr:hypothetical protein [Brevibacillus sp. VP]